MSDLATILPVFDAIVFGLLPEPRYGLPVTQPTPKRSLKMSKPSKKFEQPKKAAAPEAKAAAPAAPAKAPAHA